MEEEPRRFFFHFDDIDNKNGSILKSDENIFPYSVMKMEWQKNPALKDKEVKEFKMTSEL